MNGVGERPCAIYLPDGEVLRIAAGPKVTANELLRKIDTYCGITFKEESARCLQLAFVDQNEQVCWLRGDRAVLDFDFPQHYVGSGAEVPLHNLFRLYPNPLHLKDPKILVFLFWDVRQQFLEGHVDLDLSKYTKCCACLIILSSSSSMSKQTIVDAFQLQISPHIALLKRFDVSVDEIQQQIYREYTALKHLNQAELMLEFVLLLDTFSSMHGSYFYQVSEKSGQKCKLAVNGRGLVQFNLDDLHRPRKLLSWQHVENVQCSDKQLTLEINSNRGVGHSPRKSYEVWDTANNSSSSPLRIKRPIQEESSECSEVNESTPISRQLSSPSRASQRLVYHCETTAHCKAIWEAVVAQHQHFLDQRTCKKVFASAFEQQRKREEQCCRLEQHLGVAASVSTSIPSSPHLSCSVPSSSSLESFTSAGMPSAKVADGANYSRNIQSINCEKTEEDKKRDVELANKLKEQKTALEDRLLQKLLELKAVCIREGEITGKLPIEIYKTLLPQEDLPAVKKRIGTTFKFSEDVLQQANLEGDRQAQLAMDIELHRKIVAAAERLAKDKSTNKSVRKKRRKDWQAASQKLKGLEKGLHKLRVSSSKPDSLNNHFETLSMSNVGSGFSLNSLKGWSNFSLKGSATKSCPTTPRGSIPDLSTADDASKGFRKKLSSSSSKHSESEACTSNLVQNSSMSRHSASNGSIAHNPLRSIERKANSKSSTGLYSLPPSIPNRRGAEQCLEGTTSAEPVDGIPLSHDYRDTPLYANVGYTSSVPYKSAYRQSNFPTIQQHSKEATNLLQKRLLISTENNSLHPSSPNSSVVYTRFSAQKAEGSNSHLVMSSSSLINTVNSQLGNIVRKMSESVTPCSSASSSSTASSGYISHGDGMVCRSPPSKAENVTVNALKPPMANGGFSTTSLDRRTSMRGKPFLLNGKKLDNKYSAQHSMITTFPVNDICRPLEPGDFSKYRSISAVRNDPPSKRGLATPLETAASCVSASRILPTSSQWPPILNTDPRMEALLASIHSRSSGQQHKSGHMSTAHKVTSQNSSPSKTANNNNAKNTATIV